MRDFHTLPCLRTSNQKEPTIVDVVVVTEYTILGFPIMIMV